MRARSSSVGERVDHVPLRKVFRTVLWHISIPVSGAPIDNDRNLDVGHTRCSPGNLPFMKRVNRSGQANSFILSGHRDCFGVEKPGTIQSICGNALDAESYKWTTFR